MLGCAVLVRALTAGRSFPETALARWTAKYQPILSLEENQDEVYVVGQYLRAHTESDAILLIPHNYLTISDEHMAEIRERYGATHAVLFKATPTRYPVLFETPGYKVVAMQGDPA